MRRDDQWRSNLRNEMRSVMADDSDYTAHRVVRRVVRGVPVESLTASATSDRIVYRKANDGEHHRALVASILRANMQAMAVEDDCGCDDCGCAEPDGDSFVASYDGTASQAVGRMVAGLAMAHLATVLA